jgi:hypothetical protein
MLLSARSVLKRVSLKPTAKSRGRLGASTVPTASPAEGDQHGGVSPALALAGEQISARPAEFVAARRQANGE